MGLFAPMGSAPMDAALVEYLGKFALPVAKSSVERQCLPEIQEDECDLIDRFSEGLCGDRFIFFFLYVVFPSIISITKCLFFFNLFVLFLFSLFFHFFVFFFFFLFFFLRFHRDSATLLERNYGRMLRDAGGCVAVVESSQRYNT